MFDNNVMTMSTPHRDRRARARFINDFRSIHEARMDFFYKKKIKTSKIRVRSMRFFFCLIRRRYVSCDHQQMAFRRAPKKIGQFLFCPLTL